MRERLLAWLKHPVGPSSTFDDLYRLNSTGRMIGGRVTTVEDDTRDAAAAARWERSVHGVRRIARWHVIVIVIGIAAAIALTVALLASV
jgi:hypothetical protein